MFIVDISTDNVFLSGGPPPCVAHFNEEFCWFTRPGKRLQFATLKIAIYSWFTH